jgi:hypothetical protein
MTLLTIVEAQSRLEALQADVLVAPRKLAVEKWNEMEQEDPDFALDMEATERANIIHGLTRSRVRKALATVDASAAHELTSLGFFAVAFGDDLIVRYKFVGNGEPSNVATNRQKELAKHEFDDKLMGKLALEGVPNPPTIATCGYTLDFSGKLETVSVRCDHSGNTLWQYTVWGDDKGGFGTTAMPSIMPELDPTATTIRSTRRVREAEADREAN